MSGEPRVVYLIGFSAPPVLQLDEFILLLASEGWDTHVILSPTAASWVDSQRFADISGHPVRVEPRNPQEKNSMPPADAIMAAPLTFNSLNKWTAGINDSLALGILNEALGLDLPRITAPCVKHQLRQHPAYERSLALLKEAGVSVLESPVNTPLEPLGSLFRSWLNELAQRRRI